MCYVNKVFFVDEVIVYVCNGSCLMLGEFVGVGELVCCIEVLFVSGIG